MNSNAQSLSTDLWQLAQGETARILGYKTDLAPAIRVRMTELGFREGALVSCTLKPRLGAPRFYRVANSIYSLERDIAQLILIESSN